MLRMYSFLLGILVMQKSYATPDGCNHRHQLLSSLQTVNFVNITLIHNGCKYEKQLTFQQ